MNQKGRDPNHVIRECPKPPRDMNQRAFIGGSWSDNGEENEEKNKDETCLMAQASSEICLGIDLEPDEWIKDSGCMISHASLNIANVEHVDNLRFNFLSVSQICDNKWKIIFSEHDSEITKDERSQAEARPTENHLTAVKRVFRYLKGTNNMVLCYPKDIRFNLTTFADADHAGCQDTRRSTSGSAPFLGEKLVSCSSKKQKCIVLVQH
ncbi:hypothetical protein Tco_1165674 [Tanacetum coccineum]